MNKPQGRLLFLSLLLAPTWAAAQDDPPAEDGTAKLVATVQANVGQYDPKNIQRKALCRLIPERDGEGPQELRYDCSPGAIEVSTVEVSSVRVELPPGIEKMCVTAGERWAIPGLNEDCVEFPRCRPPAEMTVDLYRERLINPAYAGGRNKKPRSAPEEQAPTFLNHVQRAYYYLRETQSECPPSLSLLLSDNAGPLKIDLWGKNPDETGLAGTPYAQTLTIDLLYYKFLMDVAGFYALRASGDEELVVRDRVLEQTGQDPIARKEVLQLHQPNESSWSGIMLTLLHRSYPSLGFSVGFAFPEDRSPTYLVGLSYRFLSVGSSAIATLTGGYSWAQQQSYPGIEAGMTYDATDPRLTGQIDYEAELFVAIALGFELPSRPK